MNGHIHSVESFGTVDGPGVRYVVFFQGCPLRCKYCHNPDTWATTGGEPMAADTIIEEYEKNKAFYRNGGITATGGEPLLQMDFLYELFSLAKKKGIHTCLDTSGIVFRPNDEGHLRKMDRLMEVTDLIMLDIKHIDNAEHKILTKAPNTSILAFARYLEECGKEVWIRHVVVPGITDNKQYLTQLGEFIGTLRNVSKVQVLPYHTMGVVKYENMGIPYPLQGVEQLTDEELAEAKKTLIAAISSARNKK